MFSFIKYSLFFTINFIVLSFPISNKPLFYHLYNLTSELTEPLFDGAKKSAEKAIDKTSDGIGAGIKKSGALASKLFLNTTPPASKKEKRNKVSKTESEMTTRELQRKYAQEKKFEKNSKDSLNDSNDSKDYEGTYTDKEKEMLRKAISGN